AGIASAGPLMNRDTRPLALAAVAVALVPVLARTMLTLANSRLRFERDSVTSVDLLRRRRTWSRSRVGRAAVGTVRWSNWKLPGLSVVGVDGTALVTVTGLEWGIHDIVAACTGAGIPVVEGSPPRRRVGWGRFALAALVAVPSAGLLALSL